MASSCTEEDCICVEENSSTTTPMSTQDDEAMILPASGRIRMHRSAVRPFFCCGSELSLVSITEQQELKPLDKLPNGDTTEIVDSSGACAEAFLESNTDDYLQDGKVNRERILRKKNMEGFPRKMSRKSWAVKLRGKLPKRLKNVDEHGNLAASESGIEAGCTCTSYRQTDGQPQTYPCLGAASSEQGCTTSSAAVSYCGTEQDHMMKTKSGKGKGRAKSKSVSGPNQISVSASNMLRAWMDSKSLSDDTRKDIQVPGLRRQACDEGEMSERFSCESKKLMGSNAGNGLFSPAFQKQCVISNPWPQSGEGGTDSTEDECQYSDVPSLGPRAPYVSVHSQVDYVHCLVPDLSCITSCSFYWGVMDRYQAEKLLENKPEGTFLLRDSAQDEFLFSVSFRRYGRSLHARVEQYNHKFSFDSHDPGVFATDTVCGLIEHYKDPSCCMFFEPMLTLPLNRSFPFSLQHLCRASIVSATTYDGISQLPLPNALQSYLRYYHYKHKVRTRTLET